MAKNLLNTTAILSLAVTVILFVWHIQAPNEILFSTLITFATISYHLIMRLLVGILFNVTLNNKVNYKKSWFQVSQHEMALYKKLKVKTWKGKLPTYNASSFDINKHTLEEIVQVMCQAELVHETIALLSFLPIIAGLWVGAFPVFIITSLLAAAFDMSFVIAQRFNRQRVLRLIKIKCKSKISHG